MIQQSMKPKYGYDAFACQLPSELFKEPIGRNHRAQDTEVAENLGNVAMADSVLNRISVVIISSLRIDFSGS
jgi:hypothetical protein